MRKSKRMYQALLTVLIAVFLCSCGSTNKNEEASKKIVEKYFDALKYGDHEDEMECYTPIVRKREGAQYGILGAASKLFLKVDLSEVLRDLNTLYGVSNFDELDFEVQQVRLNDEGKKAAVYVTVTKDGEFVEYVRVDTVKYDGDWYVEYNSIAPDDRDPNEMTADDTIEEKASWWQNKILWIVVGTFIAIAIVFLIAILIRNHAGGKKRNSYDLPPVSTPPTGGTAPGEILCSCGTINPVGVRTCIGCGKKLKKHK